MSTGAEESGLALSPDGLTLYVGSDGFPSIGFRDIHRATRQSITAQFGAPQSVTSVNSTSFDYPTMVTVDDCVLLFSSARANANGTIDMYITRRGN